MLNDLLEKLKSSPDYHNEIVHQEIIQPTSTEQISIPSSISATLKSILKKCGIQTLYPAQGEVLRCVQSGENPLVIGGCSSGKTMAFHLAVLEECLNNSSSSALYILPTRALVANQYFILRELLQETSLGLQVFTYDSGTSQRSVSSIRNTARIIVTTPDTLHRKIIPAHIKWASFLSRVQIVCIDDIHSCRGIYGTQCALLFRRLQRILRQYQTKPFYIASSFPIDQPLDHSKKLIGIPFHEIHAQGSNQGSQTFVFWNCATPDLSNKKMKVLQDAQNIASHFIEQGIRTIAFTKSWTVTGSLYYHTRKYLEQNHPELVNKICHYRGGFLTSMRENVENELFRGSLLGVVTTNALEIGVNLKGFQTCLILGYPGTVSSVRQMAGRIGRSGTESLVIFLGYDTPINQYIMSHPEYLLNPQSERVLINPSNAYALSGHLACTVHELPMSAAEAEEWSPDAVSILEILQQEKVVTRRKDIYFYSSKSVPSRTVNLRSLSRYNLRIEDTHQKETIGFIDEVSAQSQLHPGAIYFHGDTMYLSRKLDPERREVQVEKVSGDYYTESIGKRGVRFIDVIEETRDFAGGKAFFGEVTVYFEIRGYNKIDLWSGEVIEECSLEMSPKELKTTGFWLEPAAGLTSSLESNVLGAMYGVGHALMFSTAILAHCSPLDVRDSYGWDCLSPIDKYALFVFDNFPGGMGYAESAFKEIDTFLKQCFGFIRDCPCADGCPSCVGYQLRPLVTFDPAKGEGNLPGKTLALQWLGMFLGLPEYGHLYIPSPEKSQPSAQGEGDMNISSLTRENLKRKFLKLSG